MTAARQAVDALATLAKAPERQDLSYLGDLFLQVGVTSYEIAGGAPIEALRAMATAALVQAGEEVVSLLPSILGQVGGSIGGAVSGVADFVPLVGQVLGDALALSASMSQASNQKSAQACQAWYRPASPSRAKLYGGLLPTDTMNASVGEVFEGLERRCYLTAVGSTKVLVCDGGALPAPVSGAPGIAAPTRAKLKQLREAIQSARGDPQSDGGMALWPIYLDLVLAQFRTGAMSWELAQHIYDCEVLPPYLHYGTGAAAGEWQRCKCRSYEQRAFKEFQAILTDWSQTLEPKYVMDQPKAAQLKKQVAAVLDQLRKKSSKLGVSGGKLAAKAPAVAKSTAPAVARTAVVGVAAGALIYGAVKLGGWKALAGLLALPP